MFLNFRTDGSGQTVQTQIRLLLEEQSDQGLHCLLFRLHRLDSFLYGRATVKILEWLQQIFWVSEYLGDLRYAFICVLQDVHYDHKASFAYMKTITSRSSGENLNYLTILSKYSPTCVKDHLWIKATCLQRPFYILLIKYTMWTETTRASQMHIFTLKRDHLGPKLIKRTLQHLVICWVIRISSDKNHHFFSLETWVIHGLSIVTDCAKGWLGGRWCWVAFSARAGILLLWHMVGHGPAVLAAGAGRVGCFFYFFHLVYPIFFF